MRRVMAGVALVVALAACDTRAEIVVNPDGSGTFGLAVTNASGGLATQPIAELMDLLKEDMAEGPVEWNFEDIDRSGEHGFRATMPFVDTDDLRQKLRTLGEQQGFAGQREVLGEDFVIERVAGGWSLRASGITSSMNALDGAAGPILDEGTRKLLERMFRFEFRIALPGYALDSNAHEVSRSGARTTFVWRSSQFATGPVQLRAHTTNEAPASFPIVPLGGAAVLLAAGAVALKRRARASGPPPVVLEGFAQEQVPVGAGAPND